MILRYYKENDIFFTGNKYETLLYTDHKPLIGLINNNRIICATLNGV